MSESIEINVIPQVSPAELGKGNYITILENVLLEGEVAQTDSGGMSLFRNTTNQRDLSWGVGHVFQVLNVDLPFVAVKDMVSRNNIVLDSRKYKFKELTEEFAKAYMEQS